MIKTKKLKTNKNVCLIICCCAEIFWLIIEELNNNLNRKGDFLNDA